jgi:hypothetical protein
VHWAFLEFIAMTLASTLFHLSGLAPISYFLPKGMKNRIYAYFVRSLTDSAIRTSRAQDIYSTGPTPCDPESPLKAWMVTSQKDLLMAFWCLKSLIRYSGDKWDIWIADGGNLPGEPTRILKQHFPGIRILSADQLQEKTSAALRSYPLSNWLRHQRDYVPAIKLFDPLFWLSRNRFLLLDSDILFFRMPVDLMGYLKKDTSLSGHAFNMERGNINSGLAVIDPAMITLPEIERHLAAMTELQRRGWPIEQDLYSLLAGERYQGLTADYAVQPLTGDQHEMCTSCHYISVCRHRFFSQGIPRLRANGFLDA